MNLSKRAALFFLAAFAVDVGCSSGGSASSDGPDTCKMVSKADVQAALGGTVGDGTPGKDKNHCRFTIDGMLVNGEKADSTLGSYVEVDWNSHVLTKGGTVANTLEMVPHKTQTHPTQTGNTLFIAGKNGELSYQCTVALLAGDDRFKAALTQLATATYQKPG